MASGWLGVFCIKVVFGCSNASEEGDELVSAKNNRAGERVTEQYEKKGRLHYTEPGLGFLRCSIQRVCLWATVALHLWGVQVMGAAEWTGTMFKRVHVGF